MSLPLSFPQPLNLCRTGSVLGFPVATSSRMTRFGESRSDPALRAACSSRSCRWPGSALARRCRRSGPSSTQTDFLKGDVEDLSIDSDGRVFLGPSTSLVAETAAPFLWTVVAGADGTLWAGTGNEGKVLKVGKDGKVVDVLRRDRARGPRDRAGARTAASTSRPRPTARSTRSRRRHGADVLRSRRQVHLGARRRPHGQPLRRDRRQGRHLQDHVPTARARASTRRTPPTSSRSRSPPPATSSPAPNRRDGSSGSTPPARRSSCSIRRSRKSTRCGWPTMGRCTRRR